MSQITIEGIGPILKPLTIPLPEGGGVVVLRGRNGLGKDEGILAARSLIDGEGSLETHDRAIAGTVEGFDCKIVVGKRTRHIGELTVARLEGGDPSNFVSPKGKEAGTRDSDRIAELCNLARVKVDWKPFEMLVGGRPQLEALARPGTLLLATLPEIASALKRDIEVHARAVEAQEENERGRATGLRQGMQGIDLNAPHDEGDLRRDVTLAERAQAELETRAKGAAASAKTAEDARAQLEQAKASYSGPTIERAAANEETARMAVVAAQDDVRAAQRALEAATANARLQMESLQAAQNARKGAEAYERSIAGWSASIDAAREARPAPTNDEIATCTVNLSNARGAVENGAIVRRALQHRAEADAAAVRSMDLKARAESLRDAARACEDILSQAISVVAPRGLRVRDGRLILDTQRGETFFDVLSKGERWKIGLDVAIDAAGPGAIIPIEQTAWESLDPLNRAIVWNHARAREATILTAQCDAGDLRSTIYDPAQEPVAP